MLIVCKPRFTGKSVSYAYLLFIVPVDIVVYAKCFELKAVAVKSKWGLSLPEVMHWYSDLQVLHVGDRPLFWGVVKVDFKFIVCLGSLDVAHLASGCTGTLQTRLTRSSALVIQDSGSSSPSVAVGHKGKLAGIQSFRHHVYSCIPEQAWFLKPGLLRPLAPRSVAIVSYSRQ